jgi:large subunit ribosomal protein L3
MIGFAKKIGMTRLFIDGKSTSVTVLEFDNQHVLQRKTIDKDGYKAVQIATKPKKKGNKPATGHSQKYVGVDKEFSLISEFDFDLPEDLKTVSINDFNEKDILDITGLTTGRGFAGVIKRHGFHGQPQTHGHDHVRAPGSIGARWPQRTLPGKKMAGRMGTAQRTLKNVKIVAIDPELKLIFVNGSVQGSNSSYLKIKKVNK